VKDIFESEMASTYAFIEKTKIHEEYFEYKKHKQMDLVHLDFNKTRRNILIFNKDKMPVHTVMDKVEKFEEHDNIETGRYFIKTTNQFPLRGDGWYYHSMVNYCLENGIISKRDIQFKILCSIELEENHFKSFFEDVVESFGKFNKLGPNSFIGCMNKKETSSKKVMMTTSLEEALTQYWENGGCFVETLKNDDKFMYLVYSDYTIKFNESRSPIYNFVLEQEIILLHSLSSKLEAMGCLPVAYNTDSVSVLCPESLVSEIQDLVANSFWDNEKTTALLKFEKKNIFKFTERKPRLCRKDDFKMKNYKWKVSYDDAGNDFTRLVDMVIEKNQGCVINGSAGCGKSHLLKQIISRLPEKSYVALAPTNMACSVIPNCITLHKFVASAFSSNRINTYLRGKKYIIVDEISMVKEIFYKVFFAIKRKFPAMKFIFCGDFRQLLPVADRINNCDYESSPALFQLCDGNKIELTHCRRADAEMYSICQAESISKVQASDFGNAFHMKNICYTNAKRIEINQQLMRKVVEEEIANAKRKKKSAPFVLRLKKLEYDGNSQDVELMVSMPVIARVNCKQYNIMNNETYEISYLDSKSVSLINRGNSIEIPVGMFQTLFYVAYAITVHKSQGQTFIMPYTIHEWSHPHFDDRLKYVALSRTTERNFINIMD
jgi:energy-coupling factor transporter ATP-binding protein EcfA2